MWEPSVVDRAGAGLERLISGETPMIIIRNFYDARACQKAADKIKRRARHKSRSGNLRHVGPFLMAYTTDKAKYFRDAARAARIFEEIFYGADNPIPRIHGAVGDMLPGYSVLPARELAHSYSPAVIRIHEKGSLVPLHKDNVRYEGCEYAVSDIDHQISCVLHLQESEGGGDLVMYRRRWEVADERFRNIDFGYSPDLIGSSRSCRAPGICAGDLVIINPCHYHQVTRITGDSPRITLGIFFGIYSQDRRIVAWA